PAFHRAAVERRRRLQRRHQCRPVLRPLAGAEGGPPRPHRGLAVRVRRRPAQPLWGRLETCAPVVYRRNWRIANPPDPESSELIRQALFSESFWNPATVFHPTLVADARAVPSREPRRRRDFWCTCPS